MGGFLTDFGGFTQLVGGLEDAYARLTTMRAPRTTSYCAPEDWRNSFAVLPDGKTRRDVFSTCVIGLETVIGSMKNLCATVAVGQKHIEEEKQTPERAIAEAFANQKYTTLL